MTTTENDPRWAQIAGEGVQIEFQLRKEILALENRLDRARKMLDGLKSDSDSYDLDAREVIGELAVLLNESRK